MCCVVLCVCWFLLIPVVVLFLFVSFCSYFILCGILLFGQFLIYRFMAGQFIWPKYLNLLPHGTLCAHILLVFVVGAVNVVVLVLYKWFVLWKNNFEYNVDFFNLTPQLLAPTSASKSNFILESFWFRF